MKHEALLNPTRLYARAEVLARPSPVPAESGVYAWYFRQVPPRVPTEGCITAHGLTLLYVGISPSEASARKDSRNPPQLRKRLRTHLRGKASTSTLRFTLGCLLSERLGIHLQRVRGRYTFAEGETLLNAWLDDNAFVCWLPTPQPWVVEDALIASTDLPLNLRGNERHPFFPQLRAVRQAARDKANALVV